MGSLSITTSAGALSRTETCSWNPQCALPKHPAEAGPPPSAARALAGLDWKENGLVFPSRIGTPFEPDNLWRSWDPVRKRLGLDLRFHDLRHASMTMLLDLGALVHIVQQIAGHSDHGVTMQVYAHASLDEQRKALGLLEGTLL